MSRILIPYGTTEGQTAKIAEVIADVIRSHGGEVETIDIRDVRNLIADGYDPVQRAAFDSLPDQPAPRQVATE